MGSTRHREEPMTNYLLRRLLYMIPTLIAVSFVAFAVITLPPGDYADTYVLAARQSGQVVTPEQEQAIREFYKLDRPWIVQYWDWTSSIITRGDFGFSFQWDLPVNELIWPRLAMTFVVSFSSLMLVWIIAIPIGVYSAVRQYSVGDMLATIFGFIGLAIPNFLFALVLMYVSFRYFGASVGGLFSPEYINAPWSFAKLGDFLGKLWLPMVVLGTAGTAGLIRVVRANLLDELKKPYVVTARAKGMRERDAIRKYPLRIALNPFVSSLNDVFVQLVSGATIVSVVLSLQTTGPLLLEALRAEDMYLAGSFIMMLSLLTVVGTLVSDLLLAWLDPRIRFR